MNQEVNTRPVVYQLINRAKNNSYSTEFPATEFVKSEAIVLVADKQGVLRPKKIRYAAGEGSIWVDEQSEFAEAEKNIKFKNGIKVVGYQEVLLQEYLDTNGDNIAVEHKHIAAKNKYRRVDNKKIAVDDFKYRKDAAEADTLFWTLYNERPEIVPALAREFGIGMEDNPFWKNETVLAVGKRPLDFIKLAGNPQRIDKAVRKHELSLAVASHYIVHGQGYWSWNEGGKIVATPHGQDPIEFLASYTFSHDDGKSVWNHIKGLLHPEFVIPDTKVIEDKSEIEETDLTDIVKKSAEVHTAKEIYEAAKSAKVIRWNAGRRIFELYLEEGKMDLKPTNDESIAILAAEDAEDLLQSVKALI
jgi:hypothetical protein